MQITATFEGSEQHYDRWRKEAKGAYEWLSKYRKEHFND